MDGARLMNASVASKTPIDRIVRDMDTLYFSLCKGLAAPIGAVLCGNKLFIEKSKNIRKLLGGGMRQCGIVASAGNVALDTMVDRLALDHERAYRMAKAIHDMNSEFFKVNLSAVQTNIFMVYIDKSRVTAKEILARAETIEENDRVKICLRGMSDDSRWVRFVTFWEITDEDIELAVQKMKIIAEELSTGKRWLHLVKKEEGLKDAIIAKL